MEAINGREGNGGDNHRLLRAGMFARLTSLFGSVYIYIKKNKEEKKILSAQLERKEDYR
jgi:hypothetical protein